MSQRTRRRDRCSKCNRYAWDATDSFCMYCDYDDVLAARRAENVGGKDRKRKPVVRKRSSGKVRPKSADDWRIEGL